MSVGSDDIGIQTGELEAKKQIARNLKSMGMDAGAIFGITGLTGGEY